MTADIRLGFSSYSFHSRLSTGQWSLADVIDWISAGEGEHLELAVLGDAPGGPIPTPAWDAADVDAVREKARRSGVVLSNLAVGADLSVSDPREHAAQVARVKSHVDLADRLGIRLLRHDVAGHAARPGDDTPAFEESLPRIVDGAREIARYAASRGITTSLENHGFFVQAADRVRRIVHAVDEPNFGTTLDVGNFVCVDEDPVASVPQNLPLATIVHLKDFCIRPADADPGAGWFRSRGGKHLRGAVVGNGDIDLRSIMRSIRESEYSGFASIEFEGWEDCLLGCERGLANARRLLETA